jgi:hypothetical protein
MTDACVLANLRRREGIADLPDLLTRGPMTDG